MGFTTLNISRTIQGVRHYELPKHTPLPKETEIPKTENVQPVKTGDSQNLWVWITALGATAGIVLGIFAWKKRRTE